MDVVLYQPQIPQNTGNIVRSCAVAGVALHLVGPLGFRTDAKDLKRAGLTYWELAQVKEYPSWESFLRSHSDRRLIAVSSKASVCHSDLNYDMQDMLVFGREDEGLPREVLDSFKQAVRIPMQDCHEARCLNLATSCGIVLYEALRQLEYPNLR